MNKWIFFSLFITNWAFGQDVSLTNNVTNPIKLNPAFELYVPVNDQQYIAGQWAKGKLFYTNGTSKHYDSLNFDRYSNVIEVVLNNKVITIRPMGLSGALIYNSQTSGSLLIVGKVSDQSLFLVVESKGRYVLASYLTANETQKVENYKVDEVRFVPKKKNELIIKENYVLLNDNTWDWFKINKSEIGKLFKVDKKDLQSMAAENGINANNKTELVPLFNLLNDN